MKDYAFGVDIGGTTIKMGLFKTNGDIIDVWEISTRKEEGGKFILGDITEAIYEKAKEKNIVKDNIEGIGVGVPGPVGPNGTVFRCVNLGWGVINIEEELSDRTGLKVSAGNNANVAALGEMWMGGGQGYRDMVMVTLGTGVGGGVIIDGHIVAGINGAAGEIGHIPVNDDEIEFCGCGKKGCLEQYASANGIVRITKKYLRENPEVKTKLLKIKEFTSKDIFDLAKAGDEVSLGIVEEVGKVLGKSLATIACVINPEVFVIGGGVSKAGDILIECIRKNFMTYAFHASRNTEFKIAKLSNNAGIYGGVKLILDK